MTNFESVRKFMETFGQEIKEKASFPDAKITSLRFELIKEELEELKVAIEKKPMLLQELLATCRVEEGIVVLKCNAEVEKLVHRIRRPHQG